MLVFRARPGQAGLVQTVAIVALVVWAALAAASGPGLVADAPGDVVTANSEEERGLLVRPAEAFIAFYRSQVRPALGQRCPLIPSCSEYFLLAARKHGWLCMPLVADRFIREPAVVAEAQPVVVESGVVRFNDPLANHDGWLRERDAPRPPAPLQVDAVLPTPRVGETLKLAADLVADGDRRGAALEYRRLALGDPADPNRGVFYWFAAYEYGQAGDYERAGVMLDRAAALTPPSAAQRDLLRGENELAACRSGEAARAFERALAGFGEQPDARRYTARRLAVARLRAGDSAAARQALAPYAEIDTAPFAALDRYAAGRGRSPVIGGLLGLVPGLGYAYSGEYGTALRSLLLNAVFIFGMVETADNEEWGVFGAIGFFELTWYSGSVFGGIDAAYRYNRGRLNACTDGITGESAFFPDTLRLPLLSITYRF